MFRQKFNLNYGVLLLIFCAGLFFRLKLYFLNLNLHMDEANLALNLIDRSYLGFFKPLQHLQIAPPLFLVLSKFIYQFSLFNFVPRFSDLILRLIPLVSGIAAIPAFGYFLKKLFKNKFITGFGMLLLAISPAAISYSSIFKQYSTELLITVLMLILFLKINFEKKNFSYFLLLGLTQFFSMSSFFVMAGGFSYIILKAFQQKKLKEFFKGFAYFLVPALLYILIFLIPVYSSQYADMADYWNLSFSMASNPFDYLKVLLFYLFRIHAVTFLSLYLVFSAIIMGIKNFKLFSLTISPLLITYFAVILKQYPLDERFVLFLLPLIVITLLYPLVFIPEKIYHSRGWIFQIILLCLLVFGSLKLPPVEAIVVKQETGRDVWEYLNEHYDAKTPIIIGHSLSANLYYRMFYIHSLKIYNAALADNWAEVLKSLPDGDYYLVISRYEQYGEDFALALSQYADILEQKEFKPSRMPDVQGVKSGRLIKIRKIS